MKKLLTIAALAFSMNAVSQEVYIPNAFSPNGDGINDIWKPVFNDTLSVKQYDLQIFDRNGVLIFKTSTPTEYWDGTWLGMSLSNSIFDTTYVYRLSMKCEGYPEGFSKSGTLTSVH